MPLHFACPSSFWRIGSSLGLCGALASGCGTDAVGVSACRDIELTRCRAGVACRLVSDEAACERFARDHCLHGVEGDEAPRATDVSRCVNAIEAAGECAEEDRSMAAEDCSRVRLTPELSRTARSALDVCEVILEPEKMDSCSFLTLIEDEDEEEPDEIDGGIDGADD